jgi:putative ABC transport system permease protein
MSWKRFFRRGKWDEERARELASHLQIEADDNISRGMVPEEARFAANRKLGNSLQIREEIFRMNSLGFLETLWQDVKYGVRAFARKPGFTTFAIGVLALGIAANTSIFSLASAVLVRALPYPNPERLVMVWEDATFYGFPEDTPSPGNFSSWKTQNHTLEDMAAKRDIAINLTGDGQPERLEGQSVTANFFSVVGVRPAMGSDFTPEEDHPDTNRVVVLSYGMWLTRYAGDPQAIGKQIVLDNQNYTIQGVMPRGFQFAERGIDVWIPMGMSEKTLKNRDSHYLEVVGRLKPGVTVAQANSDLRTIAAQLAKEFPATNEHVGAYAVPLREHLVGKLRPAILLLVTAVVFVLLIACANVANLLLARASGRQREIAVRMALGAGRWRIVRQMLTESLLLSVVAGGVGVLLSVAIVKFLATLVPTALPVTNQIGINLSVLAFSLFLSFATGIIFGVVPAFRVSGLNLDQTLRTSGLRGAVGLGSPRMRSALVVVEFALAIVLLSGAGLMIRSFSALHGLDPGFRTDKVFVFRTPLPRPRYAEAAKRIEFFDEALPRIKSLPGVDSVGCTTWVPLTNFGGATGIALEGEAPPPPGSAAIINITNVREVNDTYLQTLGVVLKRGRWMNQHDNGQAAPVALINETAMRQLWPGKDPMGLRFKLGEAASKGPWITVAGIVGDMHQAGLALPPRPEMYFPYSQQGELGFDPEYIIVKSAGDPAQLARAVREEIWKVDKLQPVAGGFPLSNLVNDELAPRRTQANLLGAFAGLALLLAGLGIYAVISFAVAQRTQEIGIRMALGAQSGNVVSMVLGEGVRTMLIGIAIGLVSALALARAVAHLLYGVAPTDPVTFVIVPLVLAAVGVLACWIPARRATRVDPLIALRYE